MYGCAAYQSKSADKYGWEHSWRSSSEKTRHYKSKGIAEMGTKGQVVWWPSSHGRGFPSEAWSSQEQLSSFYSFISYHIIIMNILIVTGMNLLSVKMIYIENYVEDCFSTQLLWEILLLRWVEVIFIENSKVLQSSLSTLFTHCMSG